MSESTWQAILFWLLAVAACASAIAVVLTQNIVRMAFWLLISLSAVAGLFFLLGADFVGATQLLIYVGGTLVLLIFGVMLTASGPFVSLKTSARDWVLAAIVGSSLLALLIASVVSPEVQWALVDPAAQPTMDATQGTTTELGLALLGVRKNPAQNGYLFPFEIASVHLLVVLIGAAYLARTKRRAGGEGPHANA